MKVLSIDVGSYSVKFCLSDVRRSSIHINRLLQFPLSDQSLDLDKQMPELATFVSDAIITNHLSYDRLVLGIPATMCSFRFMELPFTSRKKIEKVLPFEVEDLVPFSSEEVIIDYQPIAVKKNSTEILAAMVPVVNYENYLYSFSEKHVESDVVMPDVVGISVFCERFFPPTAKTDVVIDIGHRHSCIAFVQNGKMVYIRPIPFGYTSFCQRVRDKTGYSREDVESLIFQYDELTPEKRREYQPILDDAFTDLVVEANQTIVAFKAKNKGDIGDVYVSGGFGAFSYVIPTIKGELPYPVESISVVEKSVKSSESVDLRYFATAIGFTARYALEDHTSFINFRRKETKARKIIEGIKQYFESQATRRAFKASVILLAVFIPYLIGKAILVDIHHERSTQKIDRLIRKAVKGNIRKRKRLEFVKNPEKLLVFLKNSLDAGRTKIEVFQKQHRLASSVLDRLSKAMPRGVQMDVEEMEFGQSSVRLVVKVLKGNVQGFVDRLKAWSEVSKVDSHFVSKDRLEIAFDFVGSEGKE